MNEKTTIEIERRRLEIKFEGLTELEISAVTRMVNEKMAQVKAHNHGVVDTSKIAILTALYMADELYKLQNASEDRRRVLEHKLDQLTLTLKNSLLAAGFEAP